MFYQIDERLAKFSANVWQPLRVEPDGKIIAAQIAADGSLSRFSFPLEGPETNDERFESINWHSARPSRWLKADAYTCSVLITEKGELVGSIGFFYRAETLREQQLQGGQNASR